MSYVIMNIHSEMLYHVRGEYSCKIYENIRYAKSTCTKLNKLYGATMQWVVISYDEWKEKYDTLVPVYNNITGDGLKPIYIRKSQIGGCCDPSTERYWSM